MNWRDDRENRPRFGQMREDVRTERRVAESLGRIHRAVTIASAGCTTLALCPVADRIWAVDSARAQLALVRARLDGGDARRLRESGRLERMLERGRRLGAWAGITRASLRRMLEAPEPEERLAIYEAVFERNRGVRFWRKMFGPAMVGFIVRIPIGPVFPSDALEQLLTKLRASIAREDAPSNRQLWQLVLGEDPPGEPPVAVEPDWRDKVVLVQSDLISWAQKAEPATFDFLALSNILELANAEQRAAVWEATRRLLRPGGCAVARAILPWPTGWETALPSGLELDNAWSAELRQQDRSVLCDEVQVLRRVNREIRVQTTTRPT